MGGAELPSFHGIIGRSAAMQARFRDVEDFASSNLPALSRGESGTGKELVAGAVQRLSGRRGRGYQTINYRLWGAVLEVPALRARREDIPLLVEHFRLQCNREDELAVEGFTRQALALLEAAPGRGTCAGSRGSCTGPWPPGVEGQCGRRM
jgi:DNA-binding NtrC family response regulator